MITYITLSTLSIPYLLLYISTLQLSIPLESSISSHKQESKRPRRKEKLIIVSRNERSLDRFYGERGGALRLLFRYWKSWLRVRALSPRIFVPSVCVCGNGKISFFSRNVISWCYMLSHARPLVFTCVQRVKFVIGY